MARPVQKPQLTPQIPQRVAEPQQLVPMLYTLHDAGRLLACSRSTVARLIDIGELSAVGLGRMRRVHRESIEAYIERNRVEVP